MTINRSTTLKEILLEEAWAELENQGTGALDALLCDAGIDPDKAVELFDMSIIGATRAQRRERFEEAKLVVNQKAGDHPFKIVSFDLTTKQKIFANVRDCVANTGAMTIAARNRTMSEESDVDAFLEACIRLGLIDNDGNLKSSEE